MGIEERKICFIPKKGEKSLENMHLWVDFTVDSVKYPKVIKN